MFPYSGRPTEEFLREYRRKLNELQKLMESQGLKLQIKDGGRCIVLPELKTGLGKPGEGSNDSSDNGFMLAYSQQYNAKANASEDNLEAETVYETYNDFMEFERKLTLIHEARDNGVVIDFGSEFLDLSPIEEERLLYKDEAQLYGRFCQEVIRRLYGAESKVLAWKRITSDYNGKRLVPELYNLKGPRKERALREWLRVYHETNLDMYALIHKSKGKYKERKISYQEQQYLLHLLLNPNRIKIGSAITNLKQMSKNGVIESQTNERTLRRWCEEWAARHPAEWHQARDGSKFVSENVIKSIMRDDSTLQVGQVWVADGHTLSFDIINPQTGRAQRMTMIMVMDWASRYPVGASLAFTEDSQHILTAFRNGFINASQIADNDRQTMAVLPQYVYLDNGKAFRSKLFHEQWEDHDLNKELGGIFPRLDIGVRFAESYNAKAKIIERFFRTFQEQFERFISSFRGANIADKPATLMRNEKWIKKLYTCEPPTTEEAMQMIGYYIRYVYGITPHRGLDNRKPWEVFNSAPKPQDRLVNPSQLNFMMLSVERKAIRNEGIVLNKLKYWHPDLVFHMGKPVIIRYDLADARWVLVYDEADVFICQASLRQAQHPFIQADLQNSKSHKEYRQEYTQIKKLQRLTEQRTQSFVRSNQESVDKLLKSYINEIPADNNPTFLQAPMIEAPAPGPEEEIARLEQIVIEQEKAIAASQPEQTHNDQNQAVIEGSSEFDPFDNEEFKKMLKTIGIK